MNCYGRSAGEDMTDVGPPSQRYRYPRLSLLAAISIFHSLRAHFNTYLTTHQPRSSTLYMCFVQIEPAEVALQSPRLPRFHPPELSLFS